MDYEEYITLSSENEDDDEVQFVGKFHRGPYIVEIEDEEQPKEQKQPSNPNHFSQPQEPTNIDEPQRSQDTHHQQEPCNTSQEECRRPEPPAPEEPYQPQETFKQPEPTTPEEPPRLQETCKRQEPPTPEEPTKPVKRIPSDRELMIAKKELGNKKFRSNSFNDAIRCYRDAIELSKKIKDDEMTAILHFNLAMSYDKLGSYAQAADECAEAVKINDQYLKAHVKRAEIYMARGKYEEAVICYEHICEIDSTKRHDALQRIAKAKALAAQMKKPDQYELLELRPHFTAEQLRAAYKQKARAHHPDRHSNADIVTRRIHERIFKEASEANTYFRKRFNYH